MEGRIPQGKGIFIYVLDTAWAGSMASLADYLKQNGYSWVAPKMQDGQLAFDSGGQQAKLEILAQELQRVGIDLVGWGYIYGETSLYRKLNNWCVREKNITIQMLSKFKPIAWLVDAEKEHKNNSDAFNSAKKYMDLVRAEMSVTNDAIPEVPLGLSSYKFPDSHNVPPNYTFPWTEFISRSDFIAPQVYWWGKTYPEGGVDELFESIEQYDRYGAGSLPYLPAGTIRNDAGTWWSTPEQIDLFNQACYDLDRIVGFNYWDLRFMQQRQELEDAVNDFVWDVVPVPPPIGDCDCDLMVTKLDEILEKLDIIYGELVDVPTDPTDPPPPPDPEVVSYTTTTEKNRIYLSYPAGTNNDGVWIMEFYPGDSAPVAERIYVTPGSEVICVKGHIKTDSGRIFYQIENYDALDYMEGSGANRPPGQELYIEQKFIV